MSVRSTNGRSENFIVTLGIYTFLKADKKVFYARKIIVLYLVTDPGMTHCLRYLVLIALPSMVSAQVIIATDE
jgi:hypothetical protein